jgi:hypothetical protein
MPTRKKDQDVQERSSSLAATTRIMMIGAELFESLHLAPCPTQLIPPNIWGKKPTF